MIARRETDANATLTAAEVADIARRATFNGPVSRVEIRQLCATVQALRASMRRPEESR